MKQLAANSIRGGRYLLAVFAGLALAAAFPDIELAGLAWIAPALMVAAALGRRRAEAFRIGYVAGMVFYLASLYWLLLMPVSGYPLFAWVALSAYLALFPATWVWLLIVVQSPKADTKPPGWPELNEGPSASLIGPITAGISVWGWRRRMLWALGGAAAWVALEMLRGWLFSGFPWNPLGASQYAMIPLIQIASVTGVHGVSFLVVWGSLCLLLAAVAVLRRPTTRSVWVSEIWLPIAVVVALLTSGNLHVLRRTAIGSHLKATLVQPSIPQTMIWDDKETTNRFQQLLQLTKRALADNPDLLIWPEAALPNLDANGFSALTNLIVTHQVWMIFGSDDAARRVSAAGGEPEFDYFNSAFLFNPQGEFVATYRKRCLVIFGEYIPLVRWLPFIKHFTPIDEGYTPGPGPVPFILKDLHAQTSALICFEDVFPGVARESVGPDTDFLLNLTNDGWFREGAAQWQQAANAVFRAIENGVPLVRCANNGVTCWIDEHGRFREVFRDAEGTIHGPGFMTVQIPLASSSERGQTFYHRHGEWFGWICVAGTMVLALVSLRSLKR